ncbi:MAG: hypothetical protein K8L97_24095 [Anaerolineae bacterium]|nr:hypothetical protein [Anaerolineae bacterium]
MKNCQDIMTKSPECCLAEDKVEAIAQRMVVAARNLLEIWNREIGQILLGKQEMDTSALHHWDSEGEMITPSRRVTVRIEDGKRRLVWADTE